MHTTSVLVHRLSFFGAAALAASTLVACGGSDDAAPTASTDPPAATSSATEPPPTASETIPIESAPATEPEVSEAEWQQQVSEICGAAADTLLPVLDDPDIATQVAAFRSFSDATNGSFDELTAPAEFQENLARIRQLGDAADSYLADAEEAVAAGDLDAAAAAADLYLNHLVQTDASFMLSGATCTTDPAPLDNADLNVLVGLRNNQLDVGFGSVWVNQELGASVVRLDPATGDMIATIEVGAVPLKMQPAGDRMWVRTRDAYVGVDPSTNTVADVLPKSDVGPLANRSWATDGALWICDGTRVHRYDPATLQAVTAIDLGHDCGQVYATPELAIAWNYNEDPGESGVSAATVVDAATNTVLAGIDLPVDVGVPIVLDEAVFFVGQLGSTAVVVGRDDWGVRSTPDLGRQTGSSQNAFDGTAMYVGADDDGASVILVIDPETFEVVDTIEPLDVNSLDVLDGSLWTAGGDRDIVHRFDLPLRD